MRLGIAAACAGGLAVAALAGLVLREPGGDGAGEDGRAPIELVVDAHARIGRVRPIWDEVNLWKLDALFGADRPDPATWWGPGWIRRLAPWVRYGRLLAALGGNYASVIAPWCDHGRTSPEHPDVTFECGKDGAPGPAALNELVHGRDGATEIDFTPFRTAVERVLGAGILPHLNLSAAPAAFTGGATDFTHYHWNAAPVRDYAGWRAFVTGAFTSVADLEPAQWRVSIVNEANCVTLVGWQREVRHVGFAGTPADYARTFVEGAAAIRAVTPGVRLQAGSYVTSLTFPAEDNLVPYLVALRDALVSRPDVAWRDLRAVSLSLYETPDTSVSDFVPVRLARLARALAAADLAPLPVKVDELDVHPVIAAGFERTYAMPLDRTLYAASWHAEAVRTLLATGTVVSVAPWLTRMFDLAKGTPYPSARAYEMLGLLAGQLRTIAPSGDVAVEPTARAHGLARVAVQGETPPPEARPSHPKRAARIGAIATRAGDAVRVLVIHHRDEPVPDASPRRRALARTVRVGARNVAPGAYVVRHLAVGDGDASWNGATTPLAWHDDGCRKPVHGTLDIAPATRMDANTVWLFEATRHHRCPIAERPAS